jgi:hypothetical protein
LLQLLSEGLDGIGRTGASAAFEPIAAPSEPVAVPYRPGETAYAVMLTTAAVMIAPQPALSARDAYAAFWAKTLPGARLTDHVAQERLAGGYLARRRRAYRVGYVPFVLTLPGSVFLLDDVDPDRLNKLLRSGLKVPDLDGQQVTWRTCPFVPENGYGAITCWQNPLGLDPVRHV